MYNVVLCENDTILEELKKHCDIAKDAVIYPKGCSEYDSKHTTCKEYKCSECVCLDILDKTVLADELSVEDAAQAMNYTNYSIGFKNGLTPIVTEIRDYHIIPSLVSYSIKPVPKRSCIQCDHIKYASYKSNIDMAYCSKLDKEVPLNEILSNVMDGCPEPNVTTKKEGE